MKRILQITNINVNSLIAIMLGRLQMDVASCIEVYSNLSSVVFEKVRHRISLNGTLKARFDSATLRRNVQDIIQEQGLSEEALLTEDVAPRCKVFVLIRLGLGKEQLRLTLI